MGLVFISASFNITLIVLLTIIIAMCLFYISVKDVSFNSSSTDCDCKKRPNYHPYRVS